MMKYLPKLVVMIGILAVMMSGCAAQQSQEGEPQVRIQPSGIHEECLEIVPNQVVVYSFQTSRPVDFNIHYHRGEEVLYPVSEQNIASKDGEFMLGQEIEGPQGTCLMWENPHNVYVNLNVEYTVRDQ
ncbi:hypothetical protein GF339_13065 [candidate division KSB3 bacterium]|uniref:C-type lysozyme inhibitor domain-containing protein n=1 Tax=candidate division KSB3 bacterium TaxID=2044937 RepID=A0A9D5Q661_9BACT|nr:hypothetical protein [candidate division KSB3 bacterium]MBD3325514.1 hypothetical protein [candidate division KSB3 bacterium]